MRLLIIRHGESEADLLNVHEGRTDFSLTSRGHKQAQQMADYVAKHYNLSKIYSSTLCRAKQTAMHLSEKTSIPVIFDELLMEFNNGLIAGLDREYVTQQYPMASNLPIHEAVYEQESKLEFRFRADFILSKIISENNLDDTIAIITHGGMINQLYHSFLRIPFESDIIFCSGDTGIHEWYVDTKSRRILQTNYTAHANGI